MPESGGASGIAGLMELDAIPLKAAGHAKRAQSRRPLPTPRQIARHMLARFGWSQRQFRYLNLLWSAESGWNVHAANPYSGAYGIPQADPGAQMSSAGSDWWSNARTQIRWGLRYIKERYGSPEAAWEHELSTGWY
jgi:resuscitation-promoting factor RpfB